MLDSVRTRSRRRRRVAALLATLVAGGPLTAVPVAADGGLGRLAGKWRGSVVENGLQAPVTSVRAELEDAAGGALVASWTTLDGSEASVELAPSARPGVLAPRPAKGLRSMLGMGEDKGVARPLEGAPLLWGRRGGDGAVYVYSLRVGRDGAPALERYGFEPDAAGGGLRFTAGRVGQDGEGGAGGGLRADLAREGS